MSKSEGISVGVWIEMGVSNAQDQSRGQEYEVGVRVWVMVGVWVGARHSYR